MTQQEKLAGPLAALAADPDAARVGSLWNALASDERRRALTLAIGGDASLRKVLVTHLRGTPRYKAFRASSFTGWSAEQFADAFKATSLISPDVMQSALIALHIGDRAPMLASFLDSIGIPHTDGLISDMPETLGVSDANLQAAADSLAREFPLEQVAFYMLTLAVLEPALWGGLKPWLRQRAG